MMKYRFLLLLILLLAISINCGCLGNLSVDGQPVRLQTGGGIIFVKSYTTATNKTTEIWYRNLADGVETLLYDYGANITEPNPSIYPADNTKIVLADKNSSEDYDLYFYDLVAKTKTSLTYNGVNANSNATDRHPSFNRTGDKLVFQSLRKNSPTKFFYIDLTSTAEPKTYGDYAEGSVPVISPEGNKVAYIKEVKSPDNITLKTLWVYDLTIASSATNPKQITFTNNVDNPAWDANSEMIAVETYVTSTGSRFIATIKPFDAQPHLQQAVYSWGKNDDYRHPAWGVSGGRIILFFTGKLVTSARSAVGAVYYDEVLAKGSQAKWYLVASDSNRQLEEPCWAPDLEVTAAE